MENTMSKDCPYAERRHMGSRNWIECSKTNDMCAFQRYCIKERKVINSLEAQNCKIRNNGQ